MPPLRDRGTETEASLRRRLEVAEQEMKMLPHYDHEVINDTVAKRMSMMETPSLGFDSASESR